MNFMEKTGAKRLPLKTGYCTQEERKEKCWLENDLHSHRHGGRRSSGDGLVERRAARQSRSTADRGIARQAITCVRLIDQFIVPNTYTVVRLLRL